MPSDLPDPPYPADTKSGSFPFDVDVARLVSSDTWDLLSPEIRPWWLMLLMMSWRQTPCGAYRNDLAIIAAKIGATEKFVRVHQGDLLRGWFLCADGRLYHPVITDKVRKFLEVRGKWREQKQWVKSKFRAESNEIRKDSNKFHPSSSPSSSSSSSKRTKRSTSYTDEFEVAWQRYPKREGDNPKRKAFEAWNARLRNGCTVEEMTEGVERYRVYCEKRGLVRTNLVKHTSRFFGPDEPFREDWTVHNADRLHYETPIERIRRVNAISDSPSPGGDFLEGICETVDPHG